MSEGLAPSSRVLVIGGGVVGTAAAYALNRAGYSVTVVTAGSVGDGATAGNAGLLVPADSVVWPSPANRRAVPATLLGRGGSGIKIAWCNPRTIPWGIRFLAGSSRRQYAAACRATHTLSVHSRGVAEAWAQETPLGTDLKATGMLFLVDSPEALEAARAARLPLIEAGETYAELDTDALIAVDPAYASVPSRMLALFAAGAARGDSQAFSRALAGGLRTTAVQILENRPAVRVLLHDGRAIGASTTRGDLEADAVVLAAGVATRDLARSAGVRVPILPVKGYAATVPILDASKAPDVGGVLESHHVAFSRMGGKLRLSTGAEIGSTDHEVTADARAVLRRAGDLLFPGALDWSRASYRAEHRPMTPTGLPLIGATRVKGLYLDAGHGSLGWTQAAGSADLLSHLVAGTRPPIGPSPFLPTRASRPRGATLRLAT